MKITGWAVFWLLVLVFFLVDTGVYLKGFDTFLWKYRTPNELECQRKRLGLESTTDISNNDLSTD